LNKRSLSSLPQPWNTLGFVDDIMGMVSTLEEAITFIQICWKILKWLGLKVSFAKTQLLQIQAYSKPILDIIIEDEKHYISIPLDDGTKQLVQVVKPTDSIRYLGWKINAKMSSQELVHDIMEKCTAKMAHLYFGGRALDMEQVFENICKFTD